MNEKNIIFIAGYWEKGNAWSKWLLHDYYHFVVNRLSCRRERELLYQMYDT